MTKYRTFLWHSRQMSLWYHLVANGESFRGRQQRAPKRRDNDI